MLIYIFRGGRFNGCPYFMWLNNCHTCHGFHISKAGEESEVRTDQRGRPGIGVQIIETGETYESVEKCAKDIGGSPTAIKDILKQQNNRVSHKGYHFKRIT